MPLSFICKYKYFPNHTVLPALPLLRHLLWQENLLLLTDDKVTEMDALIDSNVQASIFSDKTSWLYYLMAEGQLMGKTTVGGQSVRLKF